MTRPQKRERSREDARPPAVYNRVRHHQNERAENHSRPSKLKQPPMRRKAYPHIHHPPEFYDSLPKVLLTRQALLEVDRRNRQKPCLGPVVSQTRTASVTNSTKKGSDALARIASSGGPDLRHLRGVLHANSFEFSFSFPLPSTNLFI